MRPLAIGTVFAATKRLAQRTCIPKWKWCVVARGYCREASKQYATGMQAPSPTPVTVLSGFLGAGKTTLLNNILHENHGHRIAVLVNDMAEVNVDADLVRLSGGARGADEDGRLVQLENGCICCTLREDLIVELAGLAHQGDIDHIIVESTGVSEPLPVAQTFSAAITADVGSAVDGLHSLNDVARLHSLVTVVDCSTFLTHINSIETLDELGMNTSDDDVRPLAFLLAEQIQFANKIVVNKTDLVTAEQATMIESLLRRLNPSAEIEKTQRSVVNVATLLADAAYDEATFSRMPAWAEELAKTASDDGDLQSEVEEYGIKHFSIRELGRPLHPSRWYSVLRDSKLFKGVMRVKGCFWTAADPNTRIDYSVVGKTADLVVSGMWTQVGLEVLSTGMADGQYDSQRSDIEVAVNRLSHDISRLKSQGIWHPVTQDRRVELVFIGNAYEMDEKRIRAAVEESLFTYDEFDRFMSGEFDIEEMENPFDQIPRCISV